MGTPLAPFGFVHVVITGATGNIGTSCIAAFAREPAIRQITAIARHEPKGVYAKTRFIAADVGRDDLLPHFLGADAVIHLAWAVQPAHRPEELARTNIEGSRRVFEAAARARAGTLVHASSVGAYSPGFGRMVDESFPTSGVSGATYSEHKARVERELDDIEAKNPGLRCVRMRPAFVFKRAAAARIRKLFLGRLVPAAIYRPGRVPFVPAGLRLQCVHSSDVADAFRRVLLRDVRGAFNVAAEPVLDSSLVADLLDARVVPIPKAALRASVALTFHLRLQPSEPGWIDLAFSSPQLSSGRARDVLEWQPRYSAVEAFQELIDGLYDRAGFATPPLEPLRG
ncbi:MAG TPA: NAD-dependent epimerase/dehydratase family protein [Polyangiaceae bacterium]|nr:NAD-dependent epimerase/dehydratase family protein [Polyangiaceae bacterium]